MRSFPVLSCILLTAMNIVSGCNPGVSSAPADPDDDALRARADSLAHALLIVDGHIDVPYRLDGFDENISEETFGGDFDYPKAVAGGLDAPFMSIYIPAVYQETGGAAEKADSLIDMVEGFVEQWPDKFAHARSVADIRANFEAGRISLPMGMENGAPIGDDLTRLQYFHERGIRYITLTHSRVNQLSDSSYDSIRVHHGLSDLGKEAVQEMNRLGIIVDISHVSDEAFYDAMEITEAPALASHSSPRHFTPGWERNMGDAMIQRLAENGGVIMVVFGSTFLRTEYDAEGDSVRAAVEKELAAAGYQQGSEAYVRRFEEQRKAHPIGSVEDIVAQINHVVSLTSIDHVGLGSDFDGVFALPHGMQDVSMYPNLIYHLLKEGYSDEDIRKILGENALRVWSDVEEVARAMQNAEGK